MKNDIYESLLEDMKNGLDEFRFNHVRSVYEECVRLSDLFSLSDDRRNALLTAAILHDIAKPFDREIGQDVLAESLDVSLSDDDKASRKTIHAITGAALAGKCYPEIVTDEIYDCIRWHSTGKENMSLIEKLLYLADYIEPTRKFEDCIMIRNHFYGLLDKGDDKLSALDSALLLSFDLTIKQLIDERRFIHPSTVKARNFLCRCY